MRHVETLGGEAISGIVCSPSRPFTVAAQTPKVAWTFVFTPDGATAGSVSYAYSIPSAGESHRATGSYRISAPEHDGTLHLSLTVSDHVVFKGFDGNIPVRYKFDLVPTGTGGLPRRREREGGIGRCPPWPPARVVRLRTARSRIAGRTGEPRLPLAGLQAYVARSG